MSFSPALIGFGQPYPDQPTEQTFNFPGGAPTTQQPLKPAGLRLFGQQQGDTSNMSPVLNGEFGFNQQQQQPNALEGLQGASTDPNHPWASFFSHPAVQNALSSLFPQQGAPGAQPNWLGNMSGQQQGATAGASAENPVVGNNFMGGNW